jgi:NADH dehydrogenase [ubiquinone] 1 alpha subcomplex assembly factor 7
VTEPSFAQQLASAIRETGPISVARYMAAANAHYYGSRDPLGAAGDFITAPEISQMFGELVGLWLADLWLRSGRPATNYVELGPGRGTLARDAARAMSTIGLTPPIHLVETSPTLRAKQAELLPEGIWHPDISNLPKDRPLMIVANEFFDALPVQQIMRTEDRWCQRMVGLIGDTFTPQPGNAVPLAIIPETLSDAPVGSLIESCPDGVDIMRQLSQRIGEQGGAMLIIDYGYEGPAIGETLQAVSAHDYSDPFAAPGEHDLSAHVDFSTLGAMAEICGLAVHTLVEQGMWLKKLGLIERAEALSGAHPDRADEMDAVVARLTGQNEMGRLFRVLAVTAPDWPVPAGFD